MTWNITCKLGVKILTNIMIRVPITILLALTIVLAGCSQTETKSNPKVEKPTPVASKSEPIVPGNIPTTNTETGPKPDDSKLGVVMGGAGKEYNLKLKMPVGWTRAYTFGCETFIDPTKLKADDPMRKTAPEYSTLKASGEVVFTVKAINNGVYEIENKTKVTSAIGTGSWKQQANEMVSEAQPVRSMFWDANMRNIKAKETEESLDPLTNTLNGLLPKGPIKVGSKWEYRPLSQAMKNSKVTALAIETVAGIETIKLKIEQPVDNPGDIFEFLVWLDTATGMQVKSELHMYGNIKGLVSKNDFVQVIKK